MTLDDVLAKLQPIQRRAVKLIYFEGRSYAETARILNVERAVIAAAIAVALRRIARHLREEDARSDEEVQAHPAQPGANRAG